jgi:hypothetical protein
MFEWLLCQLGRNICMVALPARHSCLSINTPLGCIASRHISRTGFLLNLKIPVRFFCKLSIAGEDLLYTLLRNIYMVVMSAKHISEYNLENFVSFFTGKALTVK